VRHHGRVDDNQAEIIKALRQIPGCTVQSLADCGGGVPDILCGYQNVNYLLEIKDGRKFKSQQKLTPAQMDWHSRWCGTVHIVTCTEDALDVIAI
jgi:hypothetical protein